MNRNDNDNTYVLVEFPEVQKYMDLDEFEDNSYLCTEISSVYFINADWKHQIDNDMDSDNFQPSYYEIAKWGAQFGEAFGAGDDESYDEALSGYIEDRRTGKVNSVEQFADIYNLKRK